MARPSPAPLFVAAANWAISYTAVLDGWGYDRAGVKSLFITDAAAMVAGSRRCAVTREL